MATVLWLYTAQYMVGADHGYVYKVNTLRAVEMFTY